MMNIVVVAGLPGSGKSAACAIIRALLKQEAGYIVQHRTDKEALEEQVLADIAQYRDDQTRHRPDRGIEGDHSILLNPDGALGTLQIVFKTGKLLNEAHRQLLREAVAFLEKGGSNELFLLEWAYGKDVPYPVENLIQSASQLIAWLKEFKLLDHTGIIDVMSDQETRMVRNSNRPGHIPTGEFRTYFPQEGLFTGEDIRALDGRYQRLDNPGTTDMELALFLQNLRGVYDTFLLTHIRGEAQVLPLEHQAPSFMKKEG